MSKTLKQIVGNIGEEKALDFLKAKGFIIIEQNYRYKKAEIDIIAKKEGLLVFVEVKTRKNNDFGHPEEFVSKRKIELFQLASEEYIEFILWEGNIRFDIIALTKKGKEYDILHLEDAF